MIKKLRNKLHKSVSKNARKLHQELVRETAAKQKKATAISSRGSETSGNDRGNMTLKQQLTELSVLNQIGQAISHVMDMNSLWPVLHRELAKVVDASNFYVAIWHKNTGMVEFAYDVQEGKRLPPEKKPMSNGLTEYVMRSGKPLLITDPSQRISLNKVTLVGKPAQSWLGVPIVIRGQTEGMMAVQDYGVPGLYDMRQQELFVTIAGFVAVALENSRLLSATSLKAKESQVLYLISEASVKENDFENLLRMIPGIISQTFGFLNCAILLKDESDGCLYMKASVGYGAETVSKTRLKVGKEGLTGWVADKGETLYVPDVERDNRYVKTDVACHSEVALPLLVDGKVIGVLDVESSEIDGFSEGDIAILEKFARQAALVIKKIRSENEARQKMRELSNLFELYQDFKINVEPDTLLGEFTRRIAGTLTCRKCMIALYAEHNHELTGHPHAFQMGGLTSKQKRSFGTLGELAETLRFQINQGQAAEKVLTEGKGYFTNDAPGDPSLKSELIRTFEVNKLMILPLQSRDKKMGLVYVADPTDSREFTNEDLSLGESMANQAALLLDNAMLYRDIGQGLKQLSTLYQMSQAITTSLDEDEVLSLGIRIIEDIIPADIISIMLIDGTGQGLVIRESRGLKRDTATGIRLKMGQGLAGWVAQNGEAVMTAALTKDPRFTEINQEEELGPAIVVPLTAKDKILGVLNINNLRDSRTAFTSEQFQLAMTLGNTIALTLERAELVQALDSRSSAQKALLETSNLLLGSLQISDVLSRIALEIEKLMPFKRLAIYRVNWEARTLAPVLARGPYQEEIMADPPFSMDEGIVGSIANSGVAEIVNDTARDNRTVHVAGTSEDSEAVLVVPLLEQGRSEAVMIMGRDVKVGFKSRDMEIVSLFANQAAVAWKNANLFEQINTKQSELAEANNRLNMALKRQIEVNTELSTMQHLSSTILSSLKLEEILSVIVEGIRTSLNYEKVLISLMDQSGINLVPMASSGYSPEESEFIQQKHIPAAQITQLLKPEGRISNSYMVVKAVEQDSRTAAEGWSDGLVENQQSRRLFTPLYSKSRRLLAVIQIELPPDFQPTDKKKVRSLEAFSNTAVLAIENATLFHDAQNRINELSVIYEIGTMISSMLDKNRLLENVVSLIREKLHYLKVAIFEVEPITGSLFVGGQSGYEHELEQVHFTVGGNSVVGWVAERGDPLIVPDVRKEPLYVAGDERVLSEIAVPIKREGRTIGVLSVEDDKLNAFDQSDAQLLSTLANQVAVAMDNARLYGEAKRLYEEAERNLKDLSALHNVGTTVSSTLKLEDLLVQVCHILKDTFGYNKVAILLVDALANELELMASLGYPDSVKEKGRRVKIGTEGITGSVALTGESSIISDVTKCDSYISIDADTRSEMAVPLKSKNKVIGIINVESNKINDFDRIDLNLLNTLSTQLAVAVENARLYQETEQLAVTDGLTDVFNHRYFQSFFERELNRAKRYKHPLSLIMIDIDHFKKFNDTYGHQIGDQVLKTVTHVIKGQAREVDLVARYGGEEFMLVLPETGKKEAVLLAERIRLAVKKEKVSDGHKDIPHITISLGVSSYPENGSEKAELIDYVDKSLYRAKASGRDLVKH
jgi:diguanylate cyclase (GGDEF)-like protein